MFKRTTNQKIEIRWCWFPPVKQKLEQMIIPKADKDGVQWALLVNCLKIGMFWRQYHALLFLFFDCATWHAGCYLPNQGSDLPPVVEVPSLNPWTAKEDATLIPCFERAVRWYAAHAARFKCAYYLVSQLHFLNFK